jgi:hypothetical protein
MKLNKYFERDKNMKRIKTKVFAGLIVLQFLFLNTDAWARKIYSAQNGNWTLTSSWVQGVVPVAGDTVIIKAGHTISVSSNLYTNSTYMFLIIVGTLDLTNNGKMSFSSTAKVIIETGGRILGNGNSDQLSIGTGGAEYKGGDQGNITGPSYVSDGHSPATGEGTGGCGCYTPGTIPLPVKLKAFDATLNNGVVTLRWTTILEKNFNEFVIERSTDGKDFQRIGSLKGVGFNVEDIETNYEFEDHFPLIGFNYYRLKAVDLDNTFEYFGVESVQLKSDKNISLYPNPINGNAAHIVANFQPSENEMVYVYDNLGLIVDQFSISDVDSTLAFSRELQAGSYMLKYVSKNHEQVIRFTVK